MRTALRTMLVAAALLLAAPLSSYADSAAPAAEKGDAAAPCPYAEGGVCCGTCQEKQKEAGAAAAEMGDCPCKRAAAAKAAAAKAAAEKQH